MSTESDVSKQSDEIPTARNNGAVSTRRDVMQLDQRCDVM